MGNPKNPLTVRVILQLLVFIVLVPFLPLIIAWKWDWWQAWVYGLIGVLGFGVSRVLASRRHPDLLAERSKYMRHEDIKPWTKSWHAWLAWAGRSFFLSLTWTHAMNGPA